MFHLSFGLDFVQSHLMLIAKLESAGSNTVHTPGHSVLTNNIS